MEPSMKASLFFAPKALLVLEGIWEKKYFGNDIGRQKYVYNIKHTITNTL